MRSTSASAEEAASPAGSPDDGDSPLPQPPMTISAASSARKAASVRPCATIGFISWSFVRG